MLGDEFRKGLHSLLNTIANRRELSTGRSFFVCAVALICLINPPSHRSQTASTVSTPEYIWLEAENMRGFSTGTLGAPVNNPSYINPPKSKAPGWGINGPGVSAEWSQGGESEWNSAAASFDETRATIYEDIEVPAQGRFKIWVRYADWTNQTENFAVRVVQNSKEVFRQEFGAKDVIDPHDEVKMYWGWSFAWNGADATLDKGAARISVEIEKSAEARRHVDCLLVTNDLAFVPDGRRKPDFAAMRYLRELAAERVKLSSLLRPESTYTTGWNRPKIAGRDFLMPWNITPEFWKIYDQPEAERPLYPFNAEPVSEFIKKYKGTRDVPIFNSRLIVPVVHINLLPELLKDDSAFLRYLRQTKSPFAIKINYGAAQLSEREWTLLTGELNEQFLGWISGESVGYVWEYAPTELEISPSMTRRELLEAHRVFYHNAIARKWSQMFKLPTGAMWEKLMPAQSTSSTSFAHPLSEWGVRLLGVETAAVQPMFAMRTAFTRGAARQFGGNFFYYHAPNFGDTATTFTKAQNFAGPDNFFHSRYGVTMGPSLSWYRKCYYFYYMSGAAAIYLEQGFDQFFKPGPGEHEFQLNPLGRITEEFVRFAERHPNPGEPYTPIAFLLDPAHGWEMTDHPHWPFEVSQINRSDRALRELFGMAYYPGLVVEGEPASGDRQAFVNGIFGDIFDVMVASTVPISKTPPAKEVPTRSPKKPEPSNTKSFPKYEGSESQSKSETVTLLSPEHTLRPASLTLDAYRAIVVGGRIEWSADWIGRIESFVKGGGTVVLNAGQVAKFPERLLGLRLTGTRVEARDAKCLSSGEIAQNLKGQLFRYEKVELKSAETLIVSEIGDPLVTVNKLGQGKVVFSTLSDLLGVDERITPFAAHMLAHVFADATPVRVEGDVEHLVNRTSNGWVVTIINNNGVIKPQQGMAQVDRNATVTATIRFKDQKIRSANEWIEDRSVTVENDGSLKVAVAPGGIAIIEIR